MALLTRGRAEGLFGTDQSLSGQTACYFSILHGTASELRAGHVSEGEVTELLPGTIRALLRRSHK